MTHLRWLALSLCLLQTGCIGFRFERILTGKVDSVLDTRHLTEGKSTLGETLEQLGPPDLLLQTGRTDRAYYTFWDSDYFKFVFNFDFLGRGLSWDLFIWTVGSEDLHLARLDFNRKGILIDRQVAVFRFSRGGEFAGLDNALVANFIEDRNRALDVDDEEEDDDYVDGESP